MIALLDTALLVGAIVAIVLLAWGAIELHRLSEGRR